MTALAVVLIVVAIVGLVVVAMAVQSLIVTLRSLRETVEDMRRQTLPAIAELRATVAAANGEIARVDSLLDTAEEVGARVEATSRLAWLVMRNPLVKLASASVAGDRAARRLSTRSMSQQPVLPIAIEPADDVARARGRRRSRRAG
jgi:predicted PurR-regulated permease PerM